MMRPNADASTVDRSDRVTSVSISEPEYRGRLTMKSTGATAPSLKAFMVTIRSLENGNAMLESKLVVYVMVPAWTAAATPKAQTSRTGREGMAYRNILA